MHASNKIHKLVRNTEGAGMVEYIILVGLVALFCIAAYRTFGGNVSAKVNEQAGQVTGIQ